MPRNTLMPPATLGPDHRAEPVDSPQIPLQDRSADARALLVLTIVSVVAALLFYLPFMLHAPSFAGVPFDRQGMERVYGMWDGPLFVTAAATLWDPDPANPIYSWFYLQPSDYAERFPLYPLAIRLLSPLLGYWKAALAVNVAASTGVTLLLYLFLRRFGALPGASFGIALVSIFWPPRGFLFRYVGMSEPFFLLGVLGAVYGFKSSRYWLCGVFGAVAVASRPNGTLVIAAIGLLALWQLATTPASERLRQLRSMLGLLLLPATLAVIFAFHEYRFGDWLASVHSENFVRPSGQPYPSLTFFGIGEEGIPYLMVLALAGIFELARRRHWDLVLVSAIFYVPSVFIPFDVTRYLLPVIPFTFFLAGERIFASRSIQAAVLLSLPLLYMFAWKTMIHPWYQAPFDALRLMLH